MFSSAADRLQPIAAAPLSAEDKIARVIATIAAFTAEHAFFPAIMLREVADGGVHLDPDTLKALAIRKQAAARPPRQRRVTHA